MPPRKTSTGSRATPKAIVALRSDPRVREIDDEREFGTGWWAYLRPGYSDDAGAHVVVASDPTELAERMEYVQRCRCRQCVPAKRSPPRSR